MKCSRQLLGKAVGHFQTFQWFSRFKSGRTSTDDDESSDRTVSSSTSELIERMFQIIREDRRPTIDEVSMLVGISHETCHKILTEDLKMRRVGSKFVPRILSVDQKHQRPITTRLWCQILLARPCNQRLLFISKTEN